MFQNWGQDIFFNFKGTPSWILQKGFAATWAQIIGNVRKNW
jgi:hypothetical protein